MGEGQPDGGRPIGWGKANRMGNILSIARTQNTSADAINAIDPDVAPESVSYSFVADRVVEARLAHLVPRLCLTTVTQGGNPSFECAKVMELEWNQPVKRWSHSGSRLTVGESTDQITIEAFGRT